MPTGRLKYSTLTFTFTVCHHRENVKKPDNPYLAIIFSAFVHISSSIYNDLLYLQRMLHFIEIFDHVCQLRSSNVFEMSLVTVSVCKQSLHIHVHENCTFHAEYRT